MQFLSQYGLFLAQVATIVVAIIIVAVVIVALSSKEKEKKEKLHVKKLNDKYQALEAALCDKILDKKQRKAHQKSLKKAAKQQVDEERRRIFLIKFKGDIRASAVDNLRQEITALLTIATPQDEVIIDIESPGGMVNAYGLAASQLARIKQKQIPLTVCVDKVAASGGYLMACVADKILAAPFAIIGSIGVLAQLPNLHRWLKKHDIDFEQLTAGEYKRTLTVFGENTDKARQKFQADIEEIHQIFKDYITQYRPKVNIDQVATGEHWLATKALAYQLVDDISTSDDYLLQLSQQADIFRVSYVHKEKLVDKLGHAVSKLYDGIVSRAVEQEKGGW